MNSLVIFEIVLVVSAIGALFLMRRTYFPMNLFWAVGVVSIGAAALLGALVYSGISDLKYAHGILSSFAGTIGLSSFALAAIGGAFPRQFHAAGWWIVLIAVCLLVGVLLFGYWKFPEEGRYVVVGLLVLAGLYRLFTNPSSGAFLVLGIALLVIAGLANAWIGKMTGFNALNVLHVLMAGSVLSFGVFAAKE